MQLQLLWWWDLLECVKWRSADPNDRNSINKIRNKENALGWLATYEMWYGLKLVEQQILVKVFLSVLWLAELPLFT